MGQILSKDKKRITKLFSGVAGQYDLANRVLSAFLDVYWRKEAARQLGSIEGLRVLDVCCGTGDMAFAISKVFGAVEITGCDLSSEMVSLAGKKQLRLGRKGCFSDGTVFHWMVDDLCESCLEDDSFDAVSCAFGVRNFSDLDKGLGQMYRLLRPGGEVCVLEFSMPRSGFIRFFYHLYLRWIVPLLGGVITCDMGAYRYLAGSIEQYSREVDLAGRLRSAGFCDIRCTSLTLGVVNIHTARKA